jgi:hypothetical protein
MHSLRTRVMTGILFSSHMIMSCSGLINTDQYRLQEQVIVQPTDNLSYEEAATDQLDSLIAPHLLIQKNEFTDLPSLKDNQQQAFIAKELVGKTFEPQLGQEVTFYQEKGVLKAQTLTNSALDVYIGEVNLAQRIRARHVHIVPSEQDKNKRGYVYIDRGGLWGGMMENEEEDNNNRLSQVPRECFCPITQKIMEDPVMAQDGYTYERTAILKWFSMGKRTSPKTGARLLNTELTPNHSMRSLVAGLKASNPLLARHQVQVASLEPLIQLSEEDLQERLAFKVNSLEEEQNQVLQLERQLLKVSQLVDMRQLAASSTSRVNEPTPMIKDLLALIWKVAQREVPFCKVIMLEGGLEETQSYVALIGLQQALLEVLNSQLGGKQPSLVAAIKEASAKKILDRRSSMVYERINQAAEDAREKELNVNGKVEIGTGSPSVKPSSSQEILIKNESGKDKGWNSNWLKDLLHGPVEKTKKIDKKSEAELIQQWFESQEVYDSMMLHESEQLMDKHLTSFHFQSKGSLLSALDLRGAKQLQESSFMALHTYCPNLVYLNISGWPIEKLGCFKPRGLQGRLELEQDPIFPSLKRLVIEGCKGLQEIDLSLESVERIEAKDNQALKELKLKVPNVKYIDISGHQASEEEQATWFKNLQSNDIPTINGCTTQGKSIQEALAGPGDRLYLYQKSLNDMGIMSLVNHPLFKEKKGYYQEINLWGNQVGASGAVALARSLQGSSVQKVDLHSNNIGASGAAAFAKNLKGTSVQKVDLGSNNIGNSGAVALAKSLQGTSVQTVDLNANGIGDTGAAEFAKNLQGTYSD